MQRLNLTRIIVAVDCAWVRHRMICNYYTAVGGCNRNRENSAQPPHHQQLQHQIHQNHNLDNFLNITFDETFKLTDYAYTNKGRINRLFFKFNKSFSRSGKSLRCFSAILIAVSLTPASVSCKAF